MAKIPVKPAKNSSLNPLGQAVSYGDRYDPSLLFPIARIEKRYELGLTDDIPFKGQDIWNAYEISWLNNRGLPQVAIAEFRFPADSPNIIESKSLKLYLNTFNQSAFESMLAVQVTIQEDLSGSAEGDVEVTLRAVDDNSCHQISLLEADCIDNQSLSIDQYDYQANLLVVSSIKDRTDKQVNEKLCSHLLKSNCLITNQPDWASVYIHYQGEKIDHTSLLKYLVSFRTHNEFHEQCVERIYCDLMQYCQPDKLTVYARYTRRGGLDINPWRSNCLDTMENIRLSRQ